MQGRKTRRVEAGDVASLSTGRIGRHSSSPLQFGQRQASIVVAQSAQKVHSNEQIIACGEPGGRSRSQHSQFGRSSSILVSQAGQAAVDTDDARETPGQHKFAMRLDLLC